MSSLLQRAMARLRSGGMLQALKDAFHRVMTVETYFAYAVELTHERPPLPAAIPITIRPAGDADFEAFRQSSGPLRRQAIVRDRFGIAQCYLALMDGDVAHFVWVYYPHERALQPTRFRRLRPDEAAIANGFTFPEYRGKGILPCMLRTLSERLRQEGYRYCFMYVEHDNIASQRSVLKSGGERVGVSWRIRFFFHRDPADGFYVEGLTRRPRAAGAPPRGAA